LRLFSFGGYGLALAALALVVFGAYDSYSATPPGLYPKAERYRLGNFQFVRNACSAWDKCFPADLFRQRGTRLLSANRREIAKQCMVEPCRGGGAQTAQLDKNWPTANKQAQHTCHRSPTNFSLSFSV